MKLKTYFSPKIIRILAVSLLVLALLYAAVTVLDAFHPAGKPQTADVPTEMPLSPQEIVKKQMEENAVAAKAEADRLVQEAVRAAAQKKIAAEKLEAAKQDMGEAVAKTIQDCRKQNKAWFVCKTDVECVDVIGVCGARDAANRDFVLEVRNCNRAAGEALKCDPFMRQQIQPRCIEGVCVAQKQGADPAPKKP